MQDIVHPASSGDESANGAECWCWTKRRRRMSRRLLERVRYAILSGEYDLTRHAIDEMAEDGLEASLIVKRKSLKPCVLI
jgi:hypothetical protein